MAINRDLSNLASELFHALTKDFALLRTGRSARNLRAKARP